MIFESILSPVDLSYNGNAVSGLFKSEYHTKKYANCELYVDANTGRSIKIGEYKDLVAKVTNYLQTDFNIVLGDVIALFMPNHIYLPVMHHGLLSLGSIVSPVNVMYSSEEVAHQFKVAKPRIAIVFDLLVKVAEDAAKQANHQVQIIPLSAVIKSIEMLRAQDGPKVYPVEINGDQPAYYCFSSGTSGVAKGVVTTHSNIFLNAVQYHKVNPTIAGPSISTSCVLPLSHIFALNTGVWGNPYIGNRVIMFSKFDIGEFVSKVVEYNINILYLVPPIVLLLGKLNILDNYPKFKECVKYVISGAAPISKETITLFNSKCPNTLVAQGYGLTETSPVTHIGIALTKYKYDQNSIGWMVPGVQAQLVDYETGKIIDGFNVPGELWMKGPMIMKGYLDNPEASKDAFSEDGWFKTGDVAVVAEDHQFYIIDRIKELIKSNGHQVAPAELESILLTNPSVNDAAVIGVYNSMKTSENPRAYVVLADGADANDVVRWFNKRVSKHKRLWGGMVVIDEIPKSPSGKILRKDLRKRVGLPEDVILGIELASL